MKNSRTSTRFLVNGSLILAGLILIVGGIILKTLFGPDYPDRYLNIVLAIACAFGILGSVFSIIRREIPRPGLSSIKGRTAVIVGSCNLIVVGIGEVILLFWLFRS